MEIITKKLNELKPYENNPRINDDAVEYVANSIKEFGFKVPIIIDKNNVIVTGHTRYKASKQLGLKEVPCIIADDLNEKQIKAFRLADNKVSEKSRWDNRLLDRELFELENMEIDMSDFGFELKIGEDDEVDGEVEFGEILGEEHNYIVLYFDNEVDWLQAESLFDIKPVQNYSTRIDGVVTAKMKSTGIGRVLDGKKAINKMMENKNEN